MLGRLILIASLPLVLLTAATPASAVTAAQKMETCKFGADDQQLTGAKRNTFIKRCMAKGNYEPPGRKKTVRKRLAKKPAAKKPMAQDPAMPSANEPPPPKQ